MAANRVFYTTNGWEIHLFPIQIEIGLKAYIKCIQMSSIGMYQRDYILEGDEYQAWGSDDDYIKNYICDKNIYLGRPVPIVDASGNPIVYQRHEPVVAIQDNARSVHNEEELQRIQTLQDQLDAQAANLKTITDLLVKNGMM
jgi:hypothetical protein